MRLERNFKQNKVFDNSMKTYLKELHKVGIFRYMYDENTPVNTVLPPGVLNAFSPNVIKYTIQKRTAENLLGDRKMLGDWTLNWYGMKIVENSGYTAPYGDHTSPPAVGVNYTTASVGHYRYEVGYIVGELEEMQIARANGGAGGVYGNKLDSCAMALQTTFNVIAFQGKITTPAANSDHDVYGILTHPRLNPMQTENKKITIMTYDEILNFFHKYVSMLGKQTGYHFVVTSPFRVGLPPEYLAKIQNVRNQYGISVLENLKGSYPNMTLVPCPELISCTNDNKDVAVFIGESPEVNGAYPTLELGFSRSMYFSRVVQDMTAYKGKVMEGTFGCVVLKPSLIARCKFT